MRAPPPLPPVECGSQFTAKLEGMFKDVELSDDVMAAFRASAAAAGLPPGVDVTVSVLTSGYWPTYPVLDVKLPEVGAGRVCGVRG
jgi:cullin-4